MRWDLGTGAREFAVAGTSRLPDRTVLQVRLYWDDGSSSAVPVWLGRVQVKASAFSIGIPAPGDPPALGRYFLEVEFDPESQYSEVRPLLPAGGGRTFRRLDRVFGTPAEIEAQKAGLLEACRADLSAIRAAQEAIRSATTAESPWDPGAAGELASELAALRTRNSRRPPLDVIPHLALTADDIEALSRALGEVLAIAQGGEGARGRTIQALESMDGEFRRCLAGAERRVGVVEQGDVDRVVGCVRELEGQLEELRARFEPSAEPCRAGEDLNWLESWRARTSRTLAALSAAMPEGGYRMSLELIGAVLALADWYRSALEAGGGLGDPALVPPAELLERVRSSIASCLAATEAPRQGDR